MIMQKIRSIVALSGGKDSVATLIKVLETGWVPEVVFCDTGWEHPKLYEYLKYLERALPIGDIRFLKSNKYAGFIDMVIQKKRFPSTMARFCTEVLKVEPMIDYLLDEVGHSFIVYQGIRAQESEKRRKMRPSCTYFKYYLEPYGYTADNKPKYHKYRKSDVLAFVESGYLHDVQRPVFELSADEVFDVHKSWNIEPNPLYKEAFGRVGCFPCIQANSKEVWNIYNRYPERIEEIARYEKQLGTTFFPPLYVPKRYASKEVSFTYNKSKLTGPEVEYLTDQLDIEWDEKGKAQGVMKVNTIDDVIRYLKDKRATGNLFEEIEQEQKISCDSIYNICE